MTIPISDCREQVCGLLDRYGLTLVQVAPGCPIPGSYWGEPEAGLIGHRIFARGDTPVHSVLHEAAHVICMHPDRRGRLHTDAGGDDLEECAVCYLQIILAADLGLSMRAACAEMDAWGYRFRLGSAWRWFTHDAADARAWLEGHGLLTDAGRPRYELRTT